MAAVRPIPAPGGPGSGAVSSVDGKTGAVDLSGAYATLPASGTPAVGATLQVTGVVNGKPTFAWSQTSGGGGGLPSNTFGAGTFGSGVFGS